MKAMKERIEGLEADFVVVKQDMKYVLNQLEQQKTDFADQVNREFAMHKLAIGEVVESARTEFGRVQVNLQKLYQETSDAVQSLSGRLEKVEEGGATGNRDVHGDEDSSGRHST